MYISLMIEIVVSVIVPNKLLYCPHQSNRWIFHYLWISAYISDLSVARIEWSVFLLCTISYDADPCLTVIGTWCAVSEQAFFLQALSALTAGPWDDLLLLLLVDC